MGIKLTVQPNRPIRPLRHYFYLLVSTATFGRYPFYVVSLCAACKTGHYRLCWTKKAAAKFLTETALAHDCTLDANTVN